MESLDNTPPLVKFAVCDNGPGIPPELLPKIFQPYFTTKGPRQGTGLGLKHRSSAHQGRQRRIACSHQPGKGTTFTIYLPGSNLAK